MIKARRQKFGGDGRNIGKPKKVEVWCAHNDARRIIEVHLGIDKQTGVLESVFIDLKDLLENLARCGHIDPPYTTHGKF